MEEQESQVHSRRSYVYDAKGGKNKKKLFAIIGGIIIVILIVIGASFAFPGTEETPDEDIFATPAATQSPTETPVPEEANITEEPSDDSSDTNEQSSDLDRSEYTILIQNGSGTAGAAGRLADILGDLGYELAGTENADNFDFTETEIHVSNGNTALLNLLESDLKDEYTIGDTSTDYDGDDDAVIIIGAE